jgi:hypothetical protein
MKNSFFWTLIILCQAAKLSGLTNTNDNKFFAQQIEKDPRVGISDDSFAFLTSTILGNRDMKEFREMNMFLTTRALFSGKSLFHIILFFRDI